MSDKQQIVVIHGGEAFEAYEEYLNYLKTADISLERLRFKDWKSNLSQVLGPEYDVLLPRMPNSYNARYVEWKLWFDKLVPLFDKSVIFVGHSLGGIFLAKYLSENAYPKRIKATFLVAAPFNTQMIHPCVDFNITNDLSSFAEQGGVITLYQSRDDHSVPFSNVLDYQKSLPKALVRIFEDRQHFNQETFGEIVEDIKRL